MLDFNKFDLLLIRHGQTETNALPVMMGQTGDSKLTALGQRQAGLLGNRFDKQLEKFDHIYSSDYIRAHDTAKIALPTDHLDGRIIVTPALREYSAGDWTSSSRKETLTPQVQLRMGYLDNAFQPPNGESMHQVERRASQWLEETILYNKEMCYEAKWRQDNKFPKLNIAVFSHGMTIKCLLHYIMGFDKGFTWKLTLENTSITKLVFREEGWRLITINDHAHLL
jgi:broad specificity phosphatase PhoE